MKLPSPFPREMDTTNNMHKVSHAGRICLEGHKLATYLVGRNRCAIVKTAHGIFGDSDALLDA